MAIYKYYDGYDGYNEQRRKVENQSLEDDLQLIDGLFGREKLAYEASPSEVKQEALRQLKIEYREEVNETATFGQT